MRNVCNNQTVAILTQYTVISIPLFHPATVLTSSWKTSCILTMLGCPWQYLILTMLGCPWQYLIWTMLGCPWQYLIWTMLGCPWQYLILTMLGCPWRYLILTMLGVSLTVPYLDYVGVSLTVPLFLPHHERRHVFWLCWGVPDSTLFGLCWGVPDSTLFGLCWGVPDSTLFWLCWGVPGGTLFWLCWGVPDSTLFGLCWGVPDSTTFLTSSWKTSCILTMLGCPWQRRNNWTSFVLLMCRLTIFTAYSVPLSRWRHFLQVRHKQRVQETASWGLIQ